MEARARREQHSGDDTWYLTPGSGEVHEITTMSVWNEDWQPSPTGAAPEGWILQALVLQELPPRRGGRPYGVDGAPHLVQHGIEPTRLADIIATPDRARERFPLLAAWEPTPTDISYDGLVPGHPCIVTSFDGHFCTCLYVTRNGLIDTGLPILLRDVIILEPKEFIRRALTLVESDWDAPPPTTKKTLSDYLNLLPQGLPPHPSLI